MVDPSKGTEIARTMPEQVLQGNMVKGIIMDVHVLDTSEQLVFLVGWSDNHYLFVKYRCVI